MSEVRPIVLIGAGGHASVIADVCGKIGLTIAGYLALERDSRALGMLKRLGDDACLLDAVFREAHQFIIAMGDIGVRRRVGMRLNGLQAKLATVVHPSAILGDQTELGGGTFVAAGAVINVGTRVGCHAIINTNASVDHGCILGDYVQIAPGATLGGGVICGENSLIGIGAAVRQGIHIGRGVTVGMGAAVVSDLPDAAVAMGVPARIRKNSDINH